MGAPKGKEKTPAHVVAHRVNVLFKTIISGAILNTFKLREIAVINKWDVSDRTLTGYRKQAKDKFVELADVNLRAETGTALARYQFVFNQGLVQKDLGVSLRAQKEIARLLGLNAPYKHEVVSKGTTSLLGDLSTDDIIDML